MEVYDQLMSLKRNTADLEDQNRELKEKLRFRSEDFDFKNPFWYEKRYPDRPLCPKCRSKQVAAPVGAPYDNGSGVFRRCLTCDTPLEEGPSRRSGTGSYQDDGGPSGWMGR